MKKDTLYQSFFILITEQLLIFPITFTLFTLCSIKSGIYSTLLAAAFIIMLVRSHFPGLNRSITVIISTLAIISFSIYWSDFSIAALIIAAVGIVIEIRALALIEHPYSSFSFFSFAAVGLIGYLISALYYNSDTFKPYMGILAICATLSAIFSCICMNMAVIGYEKSIGNRVSSIARRSKNSNRLVLFIFILLILFFTGLGSADTIYAFLGTVVKAIFAAIAYILNSMYQVTEEPPQSETPQPPEGMEAPTTSQFWIIVDQIFRIVSVVVLIAILLFALYFLIRYLVKHYRAILKKLWDKISSVIRTFLLGRGSDIKVDLGYEDEITSLINKNESLFTATRKWLKLRTHEGRPYVLMTDNVQRARWLYSHIVQKEIKKGSILKNSMTPKQILSTSKNNGKETSELEKAITTYNDARYGTASPDDHGIEALKNLFRKH